MKSPARGAAASIHVASAPDLEQATGGYFAAGRARSSAARSYDEAAAGLPSPGTDLVRASRITVSPMSNSSPKS